MQISIEPRISRLCFRVSTVQLVLSPNNSCAICFNRTRKRLVVGDPRSDCFVHAASRARITSKSRMPRRCCASGNSAPFHSHAWLSVFSCQFPWEVCAPQRLTLLAWPPRYLRQDHTGRGTRQRLRARAVQTADLRAGRLWPRTATLAKRRTGPHGTACRA